jgi:PBSX family phage terminase large subunit
MQKEIEFTPLYYDYVLGSNHDVIIQVGGRYSGKSQNEDQRLAGNLASKKDYKLLVVEDLEGQMSEGFHAGLRNAISDFDHVQAYNPASRVAYIENKINGNKALFKGYLTEQQRLNVKKLNKITEILVEEGEWMDYDAFISLFQQLRGGREEDRKLTILMNPVNPECFVNEEFILKPADKVYEYFKGTDRPKVFERNIRTMIEIDGEEKESTITVLIVISTHHDNPFLTLEQRASIEQYKEKDPDKYAQLAEAKFIQPKGSLLKQRNYFSLSRLDLDQAAKITGVVDTASSGTDSATLGIYAKYDEEHHYLIDVVKDADDAKKVIPRMVTHINKCQPQKVCVEKNHEGLYYESKIKEGVTKNIIVTKFHSSENKHEKILGQAGRMVEHLYIRDDGNKEYNDFVSEMYMYNKDIKVNKKLGTHDDCIDNVAMYFKHATGKGISFLR